MAHAEPVNELASAEASTREDREQDFWGHHLPSLDECIELYEKGPEPNTELMLSSIAPVRGTTVLDFACGTGITSAWLAARGAIVTGIDITPESVERARDLCKAVGVEAEFVCADLATADLPTFDHVIGQFALHHVDVAEFGPLLAARLRVGGTGAFLETMFTNPLFVLARRHVVGRWGIPKVGNDDERPLGVEQIAQLGNAFGEVHLEDGQLIFLRRVIGQLTSWKRPRLYNAAVALDDLLARRSSMHKLSYHRVVTVRRTA